MSDILFHAHSGLRYLVLLAAVVAFGYAFVGWLRKAPADRAGRALTAAFVGLLDLQVLLGIVLVFVRHWFPALAGHITMMVLAAATAHVTSVLARRRPPERAHRVTALGVGLSLLLIVGGILAIGRAVV